MRRHTYFGRRAWLLAAALAAGGLLGPAPARGQDPATGPYVPVEPATLPLDRQGVWTLHFAYLPPRFLTVDTPDRGKRQALYMVYRVWNTSDTPVAFYPQLELVTKDGQLRTFLDEPRPMVVRQVVANEDPQNEFHIQSSFEIKDKRIPVTKPESAPRWVHGVAVWMDVPEKAPKVNNFSVYVTGLSNALSVQDLDGGEQRILRKTLRVDFFRPTDELRFRQNDIAPNDNKGSGPSKWIYRALPPAAAAAPAVPGEKKDDSR